MINIRFRLFRLSDLVMEKALTFEPVFYQEEKRLEYVIGEGIPMMGEPITEEKRSLIFRRFYRGDSARGGWE